MEIYSDNGKTFVGAKKWLKQVMRDKKTQDFSAHENIECNSTSAALLGGEDSSNASSDWSKQL